MWIVILVIAIVLGVYLFKKFDKDFIKAERLAENIYMMRFENGKEARCVRIDTMTLDEIEYSIFIPVESLKSVPVEDVIVLQLYKKDGDESIYIFAENEEAGEAVFEHFIKRYQKKYYKENFALDFV